MFNNYNLWIDDLRPLPDDADLYSYAENYGWVVATSSAEAKDYIEDMGMPAMISFDHDLGAEDTSMEFLKWLAENYYDAQFEYRVHSANPVGRKNIESYIESWRKSKNF